MTIDAETILCAGLVRLNPQNPIGAGFVVEAHHILTCAHCVKGLTSIEVDWPWLDGHPQRTARIIRRNEKVDVAILEVAELPSEAGPIGLVAAQSVDKHAFSAFGFPQGYPAGVWAEGYLSKTNAEGWVQLEGETGKRVGPGFSGGPVWDDTVGGVVGMVVATDKDAQIKVAFMTPAPVLAQVAGLPTVPPPADIANPFIYGPPVNAAGFYGRRAQLAFLRNRLGAVEPGWVSIVGWRRMGKTSLLKLIEAEPQCVCLPNQNPLVSLLDLSDSRCHSPTGVMEGVRRSLQRQVGKAPWRCEDDADLYALEDGLHAVREHGYRLLVLLDELEAISAHLAQFENWGKDMRALGGKGLITLVTASKRTIPEIYRECGLTSPFADVFAETLLGAWKLEEWQTCVRTGFAAMRYPPTPTELAWVEDMAGAWPFYTQMAAACLWQHRDLARAREEFLHQARPRFDELWKDLRPHEQQALRGAAVSAETKVQMQRSGLLRADGKPFSTAVFETRLMV